MIERMRRHHRYGQEAAFLVEEGASPAQVDNALRDFGMAMGFFAMCDLAGNDIGYSIRQDWGRTGPFSGRYPGVLDVVPQAGYFGQKTGAGWYVPCLGCEHKRGCLRCAWLA